MNFSVQLNNAITSLVTSYIEEISNRYNINKSELLNLWENSGESNKSTKKVSADKELQQNKKVDSKLETTVSLEKTELTKDSLSKLTVPDLKVMLSEKGLKVSGTKQELIDRLCSSNENKTLPKPKTESENKKKSVIIPTTSLQLRRNNFNNYEHEETHLVFNTDKKVVGMQKPDGKVEPLNKHHIELCNKYKFEYYIPDNLDSDKNINSVKVKEIDDEDLDEDIIESEDEMIDDLVEELEEELEEEEELEDEYDE